MDSARVLDFASVVAGSDIRALSKSRTGDTHVRLDGHERIRHVVKFHSQFEFYPFGDSEVFRQRTVEAPETETTQVRVVVGIGARRVGRKLSELRGIEVLVPCWVVDPRAF